MNQKSIIMK